MKIELPSFLKNDINTLEEIAFCNYIQKLPQYKSEVFINTNILILVVKGTKILHLKDEDINVDANHFLFLKSGNYAMSEVLDEYYESMLFFYEDSLLLDFISKYNITFDKKEKYEYSYLKVEATQELKTLIKASHSYFTSDISNKEELIKLKLEEAFLNILNSSLSKQFIALLHSVYNSNSFKIEVEKNFSYDENILDLSDTLKMTPLSFRKKFKEVYNTTPKKWQIHKRLEKAKIMLESSNKNVSEVCMECGFENLSWFIQVFKKQYNKTPKQIKNNKN